MSALFKPSTNTLFRVSLITLGLLAVGGAIAGPMIYVRSPFYTQLLDPIEQAVDLLRAQERWLYSLL